MVRGRQSGIVGLVCWAAVVAASVGCHEPNRVRQVEAYAVLNTTVFDFGGVPVGEWREGEVRIRNVGHVPFTPMEVLKLDNNPSFQAELLDPGLRILPGEERGVRLYFHPLKEGPLEGSVSVRVDAEHGAATPVTLKGLGTPTPVSVSPAVLDFQTLELESDRELVFTVRNPVDLPLSLTLGGDFVDPFSANVVTIEPHATLEIRAKYAPQGAGSDGAQIEIRSCDGCTPTPVQLVGKAVNSALVFDPAPVPFAEIPVHQTTRSRTKMTNITWRPVDLAAASTSDQSFTPLTPLANSRLGPGQTVEVEVEYAARYSGPAVGSMQQDYTSNKARSTQVMLDARGGRPQLAIAPVSVDFGEQLIGTKLERVIRLTNAGTSGNLTFLGVRAQGAQVNEFQVSAPFRDRVQYPWEAGSAYPELRQPSPGIAIAPGTDSLDLKVFYEPSLVGDVTMTLVFRSDDMFAPEHTVTITGRGRTGPACEWEVLPSPVLDFGNVEVGRGAVLGFRFANTGVTDCAVKDIRLTNNAGGAFWMPGGELTGGTLGRGGYFSPQIAFKAAAAGAFEGELSFSINDPATPVFRLKIKAVSTSTCITAAPHHLDFKYNRADCAVPSRTTYVSNACASPVELSGIQMGNGTSDQFSFLAPPLPRVLNPGDGFEVEVTYAHRIIGQHFTPMYLRTPGEPTPYMVPLLGETNHEGLMNERFVQGTDSQLDVLFVVSNTTTMGPYQQRLAAAIPGFLDEARAKGVDVRAGVTSTGLVTRSSICGGGADGGEAGRLFPVDNSRARIAYSGSGSAAATLQSNLAVGQCHNLMQGLETMRSALSAPLSTSADDPRTAMPNDGNLGLVRNTGRLAVVFLADEDDHSGFEASSYLQFLQTFKGTGMSHRTKAHAIVPTNPACKTAGPPGPRLAEVARGTGGEVLDVCSSNYQALLNALAGSAAGAQRDFRLTEVPSDPAALTVTVDGVVQTYGTQWTWDAATNSVVFDPAAVPATGQKVGVQYRAECRVVP
ncbi:MAG: choice-of-anchor D domain-containing protein [Myxococcota bacterium]|nr:choice-of-anchor D domain-containing protein [Myxococcota bacterium]